MTDIRDQPWDMVPIVEAADSDGRIFRRGLRVGQIAPDGLTLEGSLHEVWLSISPTGRELAARLRDLADMIEGEQP